MSKQPKPDELFIVRLYDGMDDEWMDVSTPVNHEEAKRLWNEKTNNGTANTQYEDIDYYRIFPAEDIMAHSTQGREKLVEDIIKILHQRDTK